MVDVYDGYLAAEASRSPCFINEIHWEADLFLRTPFTEGCDGVNDEALPLGRAQIGCTFRPASFSSVQPHGLDVVALSSFFDHYIKIGEVIGFSLFRATGLAFAIRPKDGIAKQGLYYSLAKFLASGCSIHSKFSHVILKVQPRSTVFL